MIDLPLFRRYSCHHFCFGAPFFLLSFIALSSRFVFYLIVTSWFCLITPSVFYYLFVLTLNAYL